MKLAVALVIAARCMSATDALASNAAAMCAATPRTAARPIGTTTVWTWLTNYVKSAEFQGLVPVSFHGAKRLARTRHAVELCVPLIHFVAKPFGTSPAHCQHKICVCCRRQGVVAIQPPAIAWCRTVIPVAPIQCAVNRFAQACPHVAM